LQLRYKVDIIHNQAYSKKALAKSSVEFGRSSDIGASAPLLSFALFLCPKFVMVGVLGGFKPAVSYVTVDQPGTSTARSLVAFVGSLKIDIGETAMRNHTQKPTNKLSLKSLFFLIDSNRKTIATDLSIEQARPISSRINGSFIKFQRMGGVQ
jgi:hypothetical protein